MGRRVSSRKRNWGLALFTAGTGALLAQAAMAAWQVRALLSDSLGPLGGLGMRSMHALQSLAFDPAAPTSILRWILLSFTSLAITVVGLVLLRQANARVSIGGSALKAGGQR